MDHNRKGKHNFMALKLEMSKAGLLGRKLWPKWDFTTNGF